MDITRESDKDLSLVLWCLGSEAINMDEFRQWCLKVITDVEEPPDFFYDLIDYKGYQKDIYSVIGFVPDYEPSAKRQLALSGIALMRGIVPFEPVDGECCINAFQNDSKLMKWFSQNFPNIVLGES